MLGSWLYLRRVSTYHELIMECKSCNQAIDRCFLVNEGTSVFLRQKLPIHLSLVGSDPLKKQNPFATCKILRFRKDYLNQNISGLSRKAS